jgi:hypothetical protein
LKREVISLSIGSGDPLDDLERVVSRCVAQLDSPAAR